MRNDTTRGLAVFAAAAGLVSGALVGCSSSPAGLERTGAMSYYGLGRKDCVGTARNTGSKVWFTVANGVLSDVYHPTVDITNMTTMQYIVTDGATFTDLQTRDMTYSVAADATGMSCTVTSTAKSGKYRLVTTYATDPDADVVLTRTVVEPLAVPASDLRVYVRMDATVNGNGGGGDAGSGGNAGADSALVDSGSSSLVSYDTNTKVAAQNADYLQPTYVALKADKPFQQASSGLAGSSTDGLNQLDQNRTLGPITAEATDGNVVQVGQLDASGGQIRLALGLAQTKDDAISIAAQSLGKSYEAVLAGYRKGWEAYDATLKPPPARLPGVADARMPAIRAQYYQALNVIKGSEDKTFAGAIAAGLGAPWGQAVPAGYGQVANQGMNVASAQAGALAPYFGSYRETFSRDLFETAGALLTAGDRATAQAAARFVLEKQQMPTGEIPRNSLPNGLKAPDSGGTQLDESAFPILLAYQSGLAADRQLYENHIRKTADFIVSVGPATGVERWEEQTGYSPSTIAAQIAGLVAAGRIAAQHGDTARSRHYLATADHFQRSVKKWTVTTNGPYLKGRYFIRVSKTGNPDEAVTYSLGSGGPTVDQRSVIDQGFLELVRLGALPADDRDVLTSLRAVDQTIRVQTPSGPGIYRYGTSTPGSEDGYGDCFTPGPTSCKILGKPWPGGTGPELNSGTGHAWPVLSGERGDHAIANGRPQKAGSWLLAMSNFAGEGGLLPEQDWTDAPLAAAPYGSDPSTASIGFEPGKPAGSAMPLSWSEAQFARLVLDLGANRVLERPDIAHSRYVAGKPPTPVPVSINQPTPGAGTSSGADTTVTGSAAPRASIVVASTELSTGQTHVVSGRAGPDGKYSIKIPTATGSTLTVTATTPTGTGYATVQVDPVPSTQ